jgi:hypothetical protein
LAVFLFRSSTKGTLMNERAHLEILLPALDTASRAERGWPIAAAEPVLFEPSKLKSGSDTARAHFRRQTTWRRPNIPGVVESDAMGFESHGLAIPDDLSIPAFLQSSNV